MPYCSRWPLSENRGVCERSKYNSLSASQFHLY